MFANMCNTRFLIRMQLINCNMYLSKTNFPFLENLEGFGIRHGRIVAEDEIIRRFVNGIMHGLFLDEVRLVFF